jgi:hypothetical protein
MRVVLLTVGQLALLSCEPPSAVVKQQETNK